jgi:hypothetical protein
LGSTEHDLDFLVEAGFWNLISVTQESKQNPTTRPGNKKLWKITIYSGCSIEKWWFSSSQTVSFYQRVSQTRWMTLSQQYDWGKLCKYDTPFAKMGRLDLNDSGIARFGQPWNMASGWISDSQQPDFNLASALPVPS